MDSGFTDFFQQLPSIFIIIFCGSGTVLLGVIAYLIAYRRQKARRNAETHPIESQPAYSADAYAAEMPVSTVDMNDLPDLDDLLKPSASPTPTHKARTGTFTVSLADKSGDIEAVEVLSVLRDVADGGLIIQIGDKAYRHPPTSADAEFMRRFNKALRDLGASAPAGTPAPVASPPAQAVSTPATPPKPAAPPPVIVTPPPATSTPAEIEATDAKTFLDTPEPTVIEPRESDAPLPEIDWSDLPAPELFDLPPQPPVSPTTATGTIPPVQLPGDLPKFRIPDQVEPPKRGRRPTVDRTPVPEINLAAAIEAYLQHKLVLSEYNGRSIHIRSAPHGGVVIEVDGKFYDSVSEVSDPAIRQFIASAIEEWQSRQ